MPDAYRAGGATGIAGSAILREPVGVGDHAV